MAATTDSDDMQERAPLQENGGDVKISYSAVANGVDPEDPTKQSSHRQSCENRSSKSWTSSGNSFHGDDTIKNTSNGSHEYKKINGSESKTPPPDSLPLLNITCILSSAFAYGCIMTTLFLITLPVECERIESEHPNTPKSVALGMFVAIAGVTQLISPVIGMLSDMYRPPAHHQLGQRLPYLMLGVVLSVIGLLGQYVKSYENLWMQYGIFFFTHMIGLNIIYSMMIALIPDQVPRHQTGVANGIMAFLIVSGSLFGFGLYHLFFNGRIQDMYGLYTCVVMTAAILTGTYAHDRDAEINASRGGTATWEDDSPHPGLLTVWLLARTMLYDPLRRIDSNTFLASYTIDRTKHHDFFVVTVSRLCYYCGMSVQTFFLYFLYDIIDVRDDPESAVAFLAILGQVAGAFTCYPIGKISDTCGGGRRKPFVYLACAILASVMLAMMFARTIDAMIVLSLLLGAANGIYLTMETSLAVDCLHDNDDESGGGNAQLLGIWGVAAFLGSSLGPMCGGPLLYLFGQRTDLGGVSDDEQSYTLEGYVVLLGSSLCYFVLSAIALRWVRNPKV